MRATDSLRAKIASRRDVVGSTELAARLGAETWGDIARRAGSLWWELRAVTSLTRHFSSEVSRLELAEVYGRFSEGRAAPHMKEARRLPDQEAMCKTFR